MHQNTCINFNLLMSYPINIHACHVVFPIHVLATHHNSIVKCVVTFHTAEVATDYTAGMVISTPTMSYSIPLYAMYTTLHL